MSLPERTGAWLESGRRDWDGATCSQETVGSLGCRKVCARLVSRFLTESHQLKKKSFFVVDGTTCSLHSIVTGDKSWFNHSNPEINRQSLKQLHTTSLMRKKNTMETIFWGEKGYFSRFCPKKKQSMPLLTIGHSRSFFVHWVTNVKGRKRSSCKMPTHSYLVRAEYSDERLGTSFPSTPHSGSSPLGLDLFGFVNNNPMRGKRWATTEGVQAAVRRYSRTAEMEFYGKGIFVLLEWRQKCIDRGGDFTEKWILCTDLAGMWHFPINTFIGLPGWLLFMCTDRRLLSQKLFMYTRHRWEDNIKIDLQEVGCGGMDWIELA